MNLLYQQVITLSSFKTLLNTDVCCGKGNFMENSKMKHESSKKVIAPEWFPGNQQSMLVPGSQEQERPTGSDAF